MGWRKEGATDLKPLAKQEGGEEEERRFGYPGNSYPQGNSPGRELPGSRANSQNKSVQTDFNGGWVAMARPGCYATPPGWCPSKPACSATSLHSSSSLQHQREGPEVTEERGQSPRHPLRAKIYTKMEALVAFKGKEELCNKCEWGPPRTCKIIFMLLFCVHIVSRLWFIFTVLDKGGKPKVLEDMV